MGPQLQNSIFLNPVDPDEVSEIIKILKNKTTLDTKISALKIANMSRKFTIVIANIINNSFEEGVFPDALKIAKVVPIYKDGNKFEVENYRPISLLTSFSKIYEKLMHKRLVEFFEQNSILDENQYGFRSGRSCEHALLKCTNYYER